MDPILFQQACDDIRSAGTGSRGIGTLGERTLHAVLKHYCEPTESFHEVRVGGFVADIANENGITEIQTRRFDKLRGKLAYFLPFTNVTVVYPIAAVKWIVWIDGDTGETTKRRKSPRRGTPCDALFEMYKIRGFLCSPHSAAYYSAGDGGIPPVERMERGQKAGIGAL